MLLSEGTSQNSLQASSPIWVSEVRLARTREPALRGFAARSRVLARFASLAQIGELARKPESKRNVPFIREL